MINKLLIAALALMIWGPPRLRVVPRALEASLADPLNIDVAALLQVLVWLFGGLVVLLAMVSRGADRPPLPRALRKGSLTAYLLFCCYALLSTAYSLNALYTLFFAAKLLIALFACSLLLDAYPPTDAVRRLLAVFYTVNVAQWLAIVVCYYTSPSLVGREIPGLGYRLNAALFDDYGFSAAISGLYFLFRLAQPLRALYRLCFLLLYAFSLYFVYLSWTRSAIASAVMFFFLFVGLHQKRWIQAVSVAGCVAAVLAAVLSGLGGDVLAYLVRGQSIEAIRSMTGRTTVFQYLFSIWKESPIWGYGYAAANREFLVSFVYEYRMGIGAAHDAISKVLVDLGIAGLAILTLTVGYGFKEMALAWNSSRRWADSRQLCQHCIALFAIALLRSLVSGGVADLCLPLAIALGSFTVLRGARPYAVGARAPVPWVTCSPYGPRAGSVPDVGGAQRTL